MIHERTVAQTQTYRSIGEALARRGYIDKGHQEQERQKMFDKKMLKLRSNFVPNEKGGATRRAHS